MTEVRPLRLHDLPFAYRLAGQGISFDVQLSLAVGEVDLRQVLLARGGHIQAYALRQQAGGALAQLHYLTGSHHARLAYVAPALDAGGSEDIWLELLGGLTAVAGQHEVVSIIAEVGEAAAEAGVLRRAGFATHTRQDLWLRKPGPTTPPSISLRLASPDDAHAILGLYHRLVPGLIKQVEPSPLAADACYLLERSQAIRGLVVVYNTGAAVMVEAYLDPEAGLSPRAFLDAALSAVRGDQRAVYCRARDYAGCPEQALWDAGFEHLVAQSVMFRHTAVRAAQQVFRQKEKVDGGVPMPTSISGGAEREAASLSQSRYRILVEKSYVSAPNNR